MNIPNGKPRTRRQGKRRQYSDSEKAHALTALEVNEGNVLLTAKELGIPRETLDNWGKGQVHPEVLQLQQEFKKPLIERLDETIDFMLSQVPAKVDDAPLKHTTDSIQTLHHVAQLLRGEPTNINGKQSVDLTDEQFLERVRRVADRLRAARTVDSPAAIENVTSRETGLADRA